MGLINKGWYGIFVACGIWCLADVSSVSPSSEQTVCSDEGLTLETSAKHHILQATNIPYQPLLIKPIFSVLAHGRKTVFFKTSLRVFHVLPRKLWLVCTGTTDNSSMMARKVVSTTGIENCTVYFDQILNAELLRPHKKSLVYHLRPRLNSRPHRFFFFTC